MIESIVELLKIIALCGLCAAAVLFFILLAIILILVIKGVLDRKKQD